MEASGSVLGIGAEVYDYGDDRNQPVIFVEAGEIFSGCGGTLSCYVIRVILSSDPFSG